MLSAAASLTSFASQMAMARVFGVTEKLDLYLLSISVPSVVSGTLASVLSFSLLPELLRLNGRPDLFRAVASRVLSQLSMLSALVCALGIGFAGETIDLLAEWLDADQRLVAVGMMRWAWIGSTLLLVSAVLAQVLIARQHYYWPAVVSALPASLIIATLIAGGNSADVAWLPLAAAAGSGLACILLLKNAWHHLMARTPNAPTYGDEAGQRLRSLYQGAPLAMIALSCFSAYAVIDSFIAPKIGPGALASLGYGQRIIIAVGTVMIAGPAAMLANLVSQVDDRQGRDAAAEKLLQAIRVTLVVGLGVSATFSALAQPVVELAFMGGQFDRRAAVELSGLLPLLLLGMTPMLGGVLLLRGLFQLSRQQLSALLGAAWVAMYTLLASMLASTHGVAGIAEAYALTWWIILLAGVFCMGQKSVGERNLAWMSSMAIAAPLAGLDFILTASIFARGAAVVPDSLLARSLVAAGSGLLGILAYFAAYRLLCRIPALAAAELFGNFRRAAKEKNIEQ